LISVKPADRRTIEKLYRSIKQYSITWSENIKSCVAQRTKIPFYRGWGGEGVARIKHVCLQSLLTLCDHCMKTLLKLCDHCAKFLVTL